MYKRQDLYLQHPLQSRAGGLFVLVEGVGVDVQRGGGLAVAEDADKRWRIPFPCERVLSLVEDATNEKRRYFRCV